MIAWSMVVDLVRALVFAMAHLCGNSIGGGVLAVSLLVRVALLPVTLRAARRVLAHQARIGALAPELARLRDVHGEDHAGLADATAALYRRHDIGLLPRGTLGPMLVQFPIGAALYQAVSSGLGRHVSFLWVGDLARPDAIVAAAAALLAAVATASGPSPASRGTIAASAAITFVLAWRLSASVALYWVASNAVSAVQSVLLRRSEGGPRIA